MKHSSQEVGRAGQRNGKKGYTDNYTVVPNIHAWMVWSHLYRGVECVAIAKEIQTVELVPFYSRDSPDQTEEDWIRHFVRPHLTNPTFFQAFKEGWKMELAKSCTKKGPISLPFPKGPVRTIRDLFHPPTPLFQPDGYKPVNIYVCFYAPLEEIEEDVTPVKKGRTPRRKGGANTRTNRESSADTVPVKAEPIDEPLLITNKNFIDPSSPYERDSFRSTISPQITPTPKRPRAISDQSSRANKRGRLTEDDINRETSPENEVGVAPEDEVGVAPSEASKDASRDENDSSSLSSLTTAIIQQRAQQKTKQKTEEKTRYNTPWAIQKPKVYTSPCFYAIFIFITY
ncbi:hypothetical protein F5Y00DRAFT_266753 [Daldinia vernicosa]|uniref:uncharacterized protein n=1 Tax=Daldinia vernicosa TaxID=114800 RepID=UPI0020075FEE|nr:uncharacterized protein F5Y00DRAFT_266753 [Daldinia vernicosa]KAI0844216.1 hypothetical protein F5Y00DRAFT_266753 [Daldinia vernicosa]